MNENFNDLPWHDACLRSINIDRQKPGEQDVVQLIVDWPDNSCSSCIEFFDCYAFISHMNFGIQATETVLNANCSSETEELNSIRKKWLKIGVDLKHLKCFEICTNSTNSLIKIFALGFRMSRESDTI